MNLVHSEPARSSLMFDRFTQARRWARLQRPAPNMPKAAMPPSSMLEGSGTDWGANRASISMWSLELGVSLIDSETVIANGEPWLTKAPLVNVSFAKLTDPPGAEPLALYIVVVISPPNGVFVFDT